MPESEIRRRAALMDQALEAAASEPDKVVILVGETVSGPFIPAEAPCEDGRVDQSASFMSLVTDRLGFFLETVDQCDVLFSGRDGEVLVFLVRAAREENLDLIRNAIADEHRLLDELGIDRRDVSVERDAIRIRVPVPADPAFVSCA